MVWIEPLHEKSIKAKTMQRNCHIVIFQSKSIYTSWLVNTSLYYKFFGLKIRCIIAWIKAEQLKMINNIIEFFRDKNIVFGKWGTLETLNPWWGGGGGGNDFYDY